VSGLVFVAPENIYYTYSREKIEMEDADTDLGQAQDPSPRLHLGVSHRPQEQQDGVQGHGSQHALLGLGRVHADAFGRSGAVV
jgi:hypothetical protein